MVTRNTRKSRLASQNAWEIVGYDGTTEVFRRQVRVELITPDKLTELLRILAVKYGNLNDDEIIGSLLKRGTRGHREHLDVHRENDDVRRGTIYMCGGNPHFIARLVRST